MSLRFPSSVLVLLILLAICSCNDGSGPDSQCLPGHRFCGGICVNTSTSDEHCGSCYNQCIPYTGCYAGTCICMADSCPSGCVDLDSDHFNCGECDNVCLEHQVCYEGKCYYVCGADEDCPNPTNQCCDASLCRELDCTDLECGPDPVCGKQCGTCVSGIECDAGNCAGGPACIPACPYGSECVDLDGICEPECVLPTGKLACSDDSHCPNGGSCWPSGTCNYEVCMCSMDEDCPVGVICVNENGVCGLCVPVDESRECFDDSDCIAAIWTHMCCGLPVPRNEQYVQQQECLVEYPLTGPIPDGCEPDCNCDVVDHQNHCWPLPSEPLVVTCHGGACRMDPEPGP
jgi:hypothetical protein